jgi:hypothetical protein
MRLKASICLMAMLGAAVVTPCNPLSPQTRSYALIPERYFGNRTENDLLNDPRRALIGGDSDVFIVDGRTILLYDSAGNFRRAIGGEGNAPGEFESIAHIGWLGDTLWVTDVLQDRTTFFAPGSLTPSVKRFNVSDSTGTHQMVPDLFFADGSMLRKVEDQTPTTGQEAHYYQRVNRQGRPVNYLATITCPALRLTSAIVRTDFLYCPLPAFDSHGNHTYTINAPSASSTGPATFSITRIRETGAGVWTRLVQYTPLPIPRKSLDSLRTVLSAGPNSREIVNLLDRVLAPFQPTITAAIAGDDGTLFLRRERGAPTITYTVMNQNGLITGQFALPSSSHLLEGNAGYIWVAETDSAAVRRVTRYRLRAH